MLNMELRKPMVQYQQLPWASTVAKGLFLVGRLGRFRRNCALVELDPAAFLYLENEGIAFHLTDITVSTTDGDNTISTVQWQHLSTV